jgi:hypothetical protein
MGEGVQTGGDESLGVRRTVRTSMGDRRIVRGLIGGQTNGGGEGVPATRAAMSRSA